VARDNRPSIDAESVLERYSAVSQRDYQNACIKEAIEGINKGADVIIDLPTGTGKTLIYAPIVAEVSENGMNALVLTATKQAQRRVSSEIEKFQKKSTQNLIYGVQEYHCPILNSNAQNWFCAELKEEHCRTTNPDCEVIRSEQEYAASSLVITNFSKFLLAPANRTYDLIVLDDSHSFENSMEQAFQIDVQFAPVRNLYETGKLGTRLQNTLETFLNLFSEIFERCVNPQEKEGIIGAEYLTSIAGLVTDQNENQLKQEIIALSEPKRSMCWEIYYFIRRCKSASKYRFYVRKDYYDPDDYDSSELISRRDDILEFVISRRFDESRVILVTATPGDPKIHASSCTLRNYEKLELKTVPPAGVAYDEIDNWFQKLGILVVEDIGDTRQINSFEKAMALTTNILKSRKERALVLFKNYRDQRSANNLLSKMFTPDQLYFIDASLQDSDTAEDYASRSQISLASASSTLWEGINIKNLRLVIIVSPPFIRPHVGQRQEYPFFERKMLVRLQQGIGRIIRSTSDYGIAILTDDRFKKYIKRKMFNEKLREKVELLEAKKVLSRINHLMAQWSAS
jgi:Rad3-related DNA helicase